jgi:CRP-like cAMP-binding protein
MEELIQKIQSVQALTKAEIVAFTEMTEHKIFKQKDFFVTEGNYCNHIAIITSGFMRTYHIDEGGNEITSGFAGPGSFLSSYYSFYSRRPSFEFIQAITDCEALLLSYNNMQQLYSQSFNINVLGRKIVEQSCINKELYFKQMISLKAPERYQWFVEDFPEVNRIAQLQHIASFLGIKPETLSRIRAKAIY